MSDRPISQFIERHFRHFNAAALRDAADAWTRHLDEGGVMLVTLSVVRSTVQFSLTVELSACFTLNR